MSPSWGREVESPSCNLWAVCSLASWALGEQLLLLPSPFPNPHDALRPAAAAMGETRRSCRQSLPGLIRRPDPLRAGAKSL